MARRVDTRKTREKRILSYNYDMTTVEAINRKLSDLPPRAQEEVLEAVEKISVRYRAGEKLHHENGNNIVHPLTLIAELATDAGVDDLAERHDFYAHGKLEE